MRLSFKSTVNGTFTAEMSIPILSGGDSHQTVFTLPGPL